MTGSLVYGNFHVFVIVQVRYIPDGRGGGVLKWKKQPAMGVARQPEIETGIRGFMHAPWLMSEKNSVIARLGAGEGREGIRGMRGSGFSGPGIVDPAQ